MVVGLLSKQQQSIFGNYTKKSSIFKNICFHSIQPHHCCCLDDLRGTDDLCRKNIDIACLPGILRDSPAHRFHVLCQRSNKEVDSLRVL